MCVCVCFEFFINLTQEQSEIEPNVLGTKNSDVLLSPLWLIWSVSKNGVLLIRQEAVGECISARSLTLGVEKRYYPQTCANGGMDKDLIPARRNIFNRCVLSYRLERRWCRMFLIKYVVSEK